METNILEIQKNKRKLMAEVLNDPRLEEINAQDSKNAKLTLKDMEKVFGM